MPYVKILEIVILEIVLKAVSIDAIMCVLKFIGYIGKMKPETERKHYRQAEFGDIGSVGYRVCRAEYKRTGHYQR